MNNMILSIKKIILIAAIFFLIAHPSSAFAKPSEEEISNVLTSAETLFKAMTERNYSLIWKFLTDKTCQVIVDSVYKLASNRGTHIEKGNILADFVKGGEIARAYWNSYLREFDPDMVINQSKWTIKTIDENFAEISILYKKSPNPAILQLYRENNIWKVGLEETFGARDLIPFK